MGRGDREREREIAVYSGLPPSATAKAGSGLFAQPSRAVYKARARSLADYICLIARVIDADNARAGEKSVAAATQRRWKTEGLVFLTQILPDARELCMSFSLRASVMRGDWSLIEF